MISATTLILFFGGHMLLFNRNIQMVLKSIVEFSPYSRIEWGNFLSFYEPKYDPIMLEPFNRNEGLVQPFKIHHDDNYIDSTGLMGLFFLFPSHIPRFIFRTRHPPRFYQNLVTPIGSLIMVLISCSQIS